MRNVELMGQLTLYCLIIANVYIPARFISRAFPVTRAVEYVMAQYLKVHITFNLLAVTFQFFHGHYAPMRPYFLKATFLLTVWLCISGGLLWSNYLRGTEQRNRLLTIQRILTVVLVAIAIIGHTPV